MIKIPVIPPHLILMSYPKEEVLRKLPPNSFVYVADVLEIGYHPLGCYFISPGSKPERQISTYSPEELNQKVDAYIEKFYNPEGYSGDPGPESNNQII